MPLLVQEMLFAVPGVPVERATLDLAAFQALNVEEQGLLCIGQAARALGVSHVRIQQLIGKGFLRSWRFDDVRYVSAREILARRANPPPTGRPRKVRPVAPLKD